MSITAVNPPRDALIPKARILYVEDNAMLRQVVTAVLRLDGFEAEAARDGQSGVERALLWLPDLILMDLSMPVIDGFQATATLRADPRTARIPIVAYSSEREQDVWARTRVVGMNGFISKLTPCEKLAATLKTYLHTGEE